MPNPNSWKAARARVAMQATLRQFFGAHGFLEVETPCLVAAPGMEPHIQAFEVAFSPDAGVSAAACTLYLHTSPEYAMKRLLADGAGPIFQLSRVFRNGELSPTHNPEFTLLEFYRPNADYNAIMADLEQALAAIEVALSGKPYFSQTPYIRLTVRDAVLAATGVDLARCPDVASLRQAALGCGVKAQPDDGYEDVFFRLFLEKVEAGLGRERPVFLVDYPAPLAALARQKPGHPDVAERFELYGAGLELANGFSELTDAAEQRRRLVEERELRGRAGKTQYPLDERFLSALPSMPPSGGVAVGLDRVLMAILGATQIEDVLLFPASGFLR
ncbi:MAG: EF-P lysine aminoacylase EpmA [Myxococcaceae bacterium]